jgi:hypothetical protein
VARAVTSCPNCGNTVSQFAAGCAICGEDLVAARARKEARYSRVPDVGARMPSWWSELSGGEALLGLSLIVIALFLPVIGILLAGFVAFFAHRGGIEVQRNLALVAVAIGVVMVIIVSWFPELWFDLPWQSDYSGPFTQ